MEDLHDALVLCTSFLTPGKMMKKAMYRVANTVMRVMVVTSPDQENEQK